MTVALVCGGRHFGENPEEATLFREVMGELHAKHEFTAIVCGDAKGADRMAFWWARDHQIKCREFRALWNQLGNLAGPTRNRQMLAEGKPAIVIAFKGGKGTANMVDQAMKAGVPVEIIQ